MADYEFYPTDSDKWYDESDACRLTVNYRVTVRYSFNNEAAAWEAYKIIGDAWREHRPIAPDHGILKDGLVP